MTLLYEKLYGDFSQITHWTPTGILAGDKSANAAIAVSFQAIYSTIFSINSKYSLPYTKELEKILEDYLNLTKSIQLTLPSGRAADFGC